MNVSVVSYLQVNKKTYYEDNVDCYGLSQLAEQIIDENCKRK